MEIRPCYSGRGAGECAEDPLSALYHTARWAMAGPTSPPFRGRRRRPGDGDATGDSAGQCGATVRQTPIRLEVRVTAGYAP